MLEMKSSEVRSLIESSCLADEYFKKDLRDAGVRESDIDVMVKDAKGRVVARNMASACAASHNYFRRDLADRLFAEGRRADSDLVLAASFDDIYEAVLNAVNGRKFRLG